MDILIKGMDMPKDDALSVIIYPDGVVEVQVGWNGDIPVYSNAFNATAIPVPEHGDLIDRDALKEDAKRIQKNDTGFFIDSMSYGEALSRAVDKAEVVLERTT